MPGPSLPGRGCQDTAAPGPRAANAHRAPACSGPEKSHSSVGQQLFLLTRAFPVGRGLSLKEEMCGCRELHRYWQCYKSKELGNRTSEASNSALSPYLGGDVISGRRERTQDTDRKAKNQGHLFSWRLLRKRDGRLPLSGKISIKIIPVGQMLYLDHLQILPSPIAAPYTEASRVP